MTRARALKQTIRARAAKTGERYTTARRHILRELNQPAKGGSEDPPLRAKIPAVAQAKGGLSDAKTIEKTGHDLAHWFDVMDRFGGVDKGHTALTEHLYEKYQVPGWYCQGIVVAYERARGKRVMNQKCDGSFEVSVSKVIAAKVPALVKSLSDAKQRKAWSGGADAGFVKALETGLKNPKSKGFVMKPNGEARYRYKWDDVTVQFNLYPKGPGKTSIVASTQNLPGPEAIEKYRALWKAAFAALASAYAP
ncbi:MAG: DUF4287 domain-containing protein [Cyanobacteria bacterium]|nr:DUF4287 domain-containing protein [Cyanobacteriota bacterium]